MCYNVGGTIDEHELYDYRILTTKIEIVLRKRDM